MPERTCLTCRWISDPDEPHRWHACEWPMHERAPLAIVRAKHLINRDRPFENCPAYEERKP